ncbi:GGDEF domain-containing protein [Alteromonas sp. BL110]|uniref:GGDEF domain-containing protein n=1 Tax=Alteromonas sp. BL110 TaxID=1714845 RepID=UPI000E544F25|nr:GGDEF domain-containing protein [Alteromonas sp. BL110]AXT37514.1 GGDEF domain-containing protein [Alteromonas sp. BL110]RKM80253.1 diguanylate cyclase [Alteromonas sp. BL110]
MAAWCRFTRVKFCLLFIIFFSHSLQAQLDNNSEKLRLKKLDAYSRLAAITIYNWNNQSDIDNDQIKAKIKDLKIQTDDSSEGVIFRHLFATGTANETEGPRVPIYVKTPLLESHWNELKSLNTDLYAAARAYYIYARAVNDFDSSSLRINVTVPALKRLKREVLETGSKTATAIASVWLSMELTLANPIQAINELEYALPHLPARSSTLTMENALDSDTAHEWLRIAFTELSVPSRAFTHSMKIIEQSKLNDVFITWAYFTSVDSLLLQSKYKDALLISDKALEFVKTRNTELEMFLTLYQRLRVLMMGFRRTHDNEIQSVVNKIDTLNIDKTKINPEELVYLYQSYKAIVKNNERQLSLSVNKFEDVVLKKLTATEFKKQYLLRKERELVRIYDTAGNYEKAYEHLKAYNQLLFEKNTEQFQFSSSDFSNSIEKDIELVHYRQKEINALRDEKEGLSTDKEAMKTTIFALIVTILLILALWLWISKRQSDLLAERDSLTGALTRRAMLNSLKKSLKGNNTSCIALLDVDNFKKINDRYGHTVGDEVLTTLTRIINNRIRKSDKLCRYGGEEFLIYFSDSDEQSAKRILDELNVALSHQKNWTHTNKKFSVSFSSGLLNVGGETNLDTIIKACDELLYKAKRSGRARVESFAY